MSDGNPQRCFPTGWTASEEASSCPPSSRPRLGEPTLRPGGGESACAIAGATLNANTEKTSSLDNRLTRILPSTATRQNPSAHNHRILRVCQQLARLASAVGILD